MYQHILKHLINDMKKSEQEDNTTLVHYSPTPGLKTIEPKFHGVRGIGEEVKRTSPEHKHAFYYKEGTQPEDIVMSGAKSKYTTKLGNKKVYDIATDPHGVIAAAKEKANQKMINRGVFTHDDMHDAIKAAGFHGFTNSSLGPQMGNVVAMYHPMEVQEHPLDMKKTESVEWETAKINVSKKSAKAQARHKFKPAKWTHPNGHPRCLICGDEESIGGFCDPVKKSEPNDGQTSLPKVKMPAQAKPIVAPKSPEPNLANPQKDPVPARKIAPNPNMGLKPQTNPNMGLPQKPAAPAQAAHPVTQPHIIFSAENPFHPSSVNVPHDKLLASLKAKGFDVQGANGKYDNEEKSIVVKNPSPRQSQFIHHLATKMGQDSLIHSDGKNHEMRFLNGPNAGKHHKGQGTNFHQQKPENYYTQLDDGSLFTHNFDFGNLHPNKAK
jgi:hypothetical protein